MDIFEFFENDRFAAHAGVKLLEARPGYARASMEVDRRHLNAGGRVQGGALFTLADLAFAAAVNAYGNLAVSLQTSIYFHKNVDRGTLYARAQELRTGRTIGVFEVEITDEEGELIATFVASAFRRDQPLPFAEP